MPLFPSIEFFRAHEKILKNNDEYKKAGAGWEGDIVTVVPAEPGLLDDDFVYYSKLHRGEILEGRRLKGAGEISAAFVINAPYSVFKSIIKAELDPIKAIMQGRVQVRGDIQLLLKYAKFHQLGMGAYSQVEAAFIDED